MDIWDRDGRIWGSGINGALWDVGFGVEWTKGGVMGLGWENMGLRDEWGPMGCGIWGRVAQKWIYGTGMGEYGAQGWMGPYGMWDLGSGGPNVDIWDWDEVMEDMGMNVIP